MSDGQHQHKRGAAGDRAGHNPINTRTPREHICIIGGPTNTFNGWISWVELRPGVPNPGRHEGFWAAGPAPSSMSEIDYYIAMKPMPVDPAREDDPAEWHRRGWSLQAIEQLRARGWKSSDVVCQPRSTHDLYWGNFVDAAAHLYRQTAPLPQPLRRPNPERGDIVTFLIFAPAYEQRQAVDFRASPYNMIHRKKADSAKYWRQTYSSSSLIGPNHAPGRPATQTAQGRRMAEKVRQQDRLNRLTYRDKPLDEDDINHYILMRTTSENSGKIIKRATNNSCYFEYIESLVHDVVPRQDVMIKLLFFRQPTQLLEYLKTGRWLGKAIVRQVDESREWTADEIAREEARDQAIAESLEKQHGFHVWERDYYALRNYLYSPPKPVYNDIHGRPLKWKLYWNRAWDGVPNVDRNRIKITRLDYFGHSSNNVFMLQYGWENEKGEEPVTDADRETRKVLQVVTDDLVANLRGGPLARDAYACLWGCYLGDGMGPALGPLFGRGVAASTVYTDYSRIIVNDSNLPEPVYGVPWELFG